MSKQKNEIILKQIKSFSERISAIRAARLALSKVVPDLVGSSPYVIKDGKKDDYIVSTVRSITGQTVELENHLKKTILALFKCLDGFPAEAVPVDFVSSAEYREKKLYLSSTVSFNYCYELDFGRENWRLKAYDENKKEIPLSNPTTWHLTASF